MPNLARTSALKAASAGRLHVVVLAFRSLWPRGNIRPRPADPRAVVLPIPGEDGKSYYEVVKDWTAETIRARRLVMQVIASDHERVEPSHFADATHCAFGRWLHQVCVPPKVAPLVDHLQVWHGHWHAGATALFETVNAGRFAEAEVLAKTRAGAWHYAKRRVDSLLKELWDALPDAPGTDDR